MVANFYQQHRRKAFRGSGPVDPNFTNVSLLLHMDGTNGSTTFTDSSLNNLTVTANGSAQVATASPKFGTGSLSLNGTTSFLSIPHNSALSLSGGNNFTIEGFFELNESGFACLVTKGDGSGNNQYRLEIYDGNGIQAAFRNAANSGFISLAYDLPSGTFNGAGWQYVAVVRNGSSFTLWLNGTQVASATSSDTLLVDNTNPVWIGRLRSSGAEQYFLNGKIDELRITKGVARDVSVVPTAPFGGPADPILKIANLYWYYNANTGMFQTTVGGTIATNDQTVGAIETLGSSGIDATQATSTARATLSTLNSLPSLSFDGSGDSYEVGTTSNWNFLHDSTGFTVVVVFAKGTSNPGVEVSILDTCGLASANRGFTLTYNDFSPDNDALRLFVSGSGGTQNRIFNFTTPGNIITGTTPHLIIARYDGASGNLSIRVDGSEVGNTPPLRAPIAGNSFYGLNIGRYGSGAPFINGQIPLIALYNNDISLSDVQSIESYWMNQFGI